MDESNHEVRRKAIPIQAVWNSAPDAVRWDAKIYCPFQHAKVFLVRLLVRLKEGREFYKGQRDPMAGRWGDHGLTWKVLEWGQCRSVPAHLIKGAFERPSKTPIQFVDLK